MLKIRYVRAFALGLVAGLWLAGASAQSGLTQLRGPKGGDIVYGPVNGVTSVPAAMGAVLRNLHSRFGTRPEVGRVFEVRGSDSSAVYFSVPTAQGNTVAGMIIVAAGAQGGFEAGVVSDDSERLATSFNPMVQALTSAWHPAPAGPAAPGADNAPAAPLRTIELNDRTARVGLPTGWRLDPSSGGGSIIASGPNGEFVALAAPYLAIDNSTPQGRQLQQRSMHGDLRNSSYANLLFYPFGQPLGRTFADLARMNGERAHAAPMPMRIDSEEPVASQGGARCARLRGEGGLQGGQGPASFDTVFCASPPGSGGSWMALAYHVAAPSAVAAKQHATLLAIRASFQPNNAEIQRMAGQYAAPGIAQIREIGRQATARAAEADQTRIAMRNRYEAKGNAQDRSSQSFSNYIRDQTVVVDRDHNTHGTTWNQTADELVRTDPRRYGYVDRPGYWKGVDF